MVVKWTPDKDSFILNHLLTSSSIKIDASVLDEMIAAWPESFGDKPTKKAFTEYFSKVRKNNKGLAAGGSPAPSTPSGGIAKKKKTPASKTPAKRRKAKNATDSEDDDEAPPTKTPAKRKKTLAVSSEDAEDEDMDNEVSGLGIKVKAEPEDEEESPSKKPARRGVSAPKYAESEGEASHASDADDADDYKEAEVDAGAEMEI
ncbi:hypothetical protein E4T47_03878 [Aureobasidium subglaciale]|nr:hypothetical protein E4T47_03878 [Aureobasidium subglaciale]